MMSGPSLCQPVPTAYNPAALADHTRLQQHLLRTERTVLIEVASGDATAPADRSPTGNHTVRETLNKRLAELDQDDFLFEGGLVAEDGELPEDARTQIRGITPLKSGAYLLEFNFAEGATRFRTYARNPALCFPSSILGQWAVIKEKAHTLIFRFVSCGGMFDPSNRDHLDELEQDNNLLEGAIVSASWLKRADHRSLKQTVASLKVVCSSAEAANHLLQSRVFVAGHLITIRKDVQEPTRCNKCQHYGHIRNTCKNEERCPSCASSDHTTAECSISFTPRCMSCGPNSTHASSSRSCPIFKRLCDDLDHRFPENSMPFFPTGEAWTGPPPHPNRPHLQQRAPRRTHPPSRATRIVLTMTFLPLPSPPLRRQSTLDNFGYSATTSSQLQHRRRTGSVPSQ
ncbi:hypothetical protein LshimejAT787_1204040 [Lyophyllum shimeji]|uniref:Nucleic-acid-binding protein from mobile element jockey n=1 Tax=Lyophyllum shimeji TaxID=47721 RepID=A0A9P3USW6_LYOSH|nr:hypothetical protein LshimejAT787_1204040 [Lyophyllum shimeji]